MKLFLLLCFVALGSALPQVPRNGSISGRAISDSLMEALEKAREIMRNGSEDLPILDPFDLDEIAFAFAADNMLSADIHATGIRVTGVSDFIANDVKITILPMGLQFDFTLPYTVLSTESYDFKGKLFDAIPIYGKGRAYFAAKNFDFSGVSKIKVGLSGVKLSDLKLNLNLESLKSETTGMLGGGDIDNVINAIIEDLAAEFFNSYSDLVGIAITSYIIPIVNDFLDGWTLQDLLDLINGKGYGNTITLAELRRL